MEEYNGFSLFLILGTIFYSILGFLMLLGFTIIFDRLLQIKVRREIVEEHNLALAIVIGAVFL